MKSEKPRNCAVIRYLDFEDKLLEEVKIPIKTYLRANYPFKPSDEILLSGIRMAFTATYDSKGNIIDTSDTLFDSNGEKVSETSKCDNEAWITQKNAKVKIVAFGNLGNTLNVQEMTYEDFFKDDLKIPCLSSKVFRKESGIRRVIIQFLFLLGVFPMEEEIIYDSEGIETFSFKIQNDGKSLVFADGKQIYLKEGKLEYFEPMNKEKEEKK